LPVILIGDIDRGGVIASLVGTRAVLPQADRDRIKAFLVNKMRGDASLFDAGIAAIHAATGWPSLGVVPWFAEAHRLPAEDILDLSGGAAKPGTLTIAVPVLPRMANFDDLDPLAQEPGVSVVLVKPGEPIPVSDVVLIPGSKSTIADLAFVRAQGWDIDILAHRRRGGRVIGLCGGYQMLGKTIADPSGLEGAAGSVPGLGLLDVETVLAEDKTTAPFSGRDVESGLAVTGYEIHLGRTDGPDRARPWLEREGVGEGAVSTDGLVRGSYVHGLFSDDRFRRVFLSKIGAQPSGLQYETEVDRTLDRLADHLEAHVDTDAILKYAGIARR
jgi:adenosylcobyric acid synthase